MRKGTRWFLGFDIGDRRSTLLLFDRETGEERELGPVATTPKAMERLFGELPRGTHVILEAGTHSGWIATLGRRLGVEVLVADTRRLDAVTKNVRKSDRNDARLLAHLGAGSLGLLRPTHVRDREVQADLSVVRMRAAAVAARTELVNASRGIAKSLGERLPGGSCEALPRKAAEGLPEHMAPALGPALVAIERLTEVIRRYDDEVERLCAKYPATKILRQVHGVGPLTALCFVLIIEDPTRFERARDVAAYVGLVPRLCQSSGSDPQMRISKTGDPLLRRLLVQCSHHILGPFGAECDLRRHGLELAARGGKNGKKRAIVATARKLSVLLLVLWRNAAVYEPVRQTAA